MKLSRWLLLAAILPMGVPALLHAAENAVILMASEAESREALAALRVLFSAHAAGDRPQVASLVEPQMIGYSRVVDSLPENPFKQQQLRLTLSDTRTQLLNDTATIQTHWEKRFVAAATRTPMLRTGNCIFVMRRSEGEWKLAALSGDNPFDFN